MILRYLCIVAKKPIINFITYGMNSKSELFSSNKMNNIYLTEMTQTDWIHTSDEHWDERDTPYLDDLNSGLNGCFNIPIH